MMVFNIYSEVCGLHSTSMSMKVSVFLFHGLEKVITNFQIP